RVRAVRSELGYQAPGDGPNDDSVASGDRTHRLDQVGGLDALEQEPDCPRTEGTEDVLVDLEGGQDEYVGIHLGQLASGCDPVLARHADVYEEDIGLGLPAGHDRLLPVRRLRHHRDVRGRIEDHHQPGPNRPLILGHHDTNHRSISSSTFFSSFWPAWTGRTTCTRQCPPPTGPASKTPPSRSTRSRIPVSPIDEPRRESQAVSRVVVGLTTSSKSTDELDVSGAR